MALSENREASLNEQRSTHWVVNWFTSPVCRLYIQVTVFSPASEETVIVMQQVTEIYGRENGGGAPTHYVFRWVPHLKTCGFESYPGASFWAVSLGSSPKGLNP